MLVAVTGASGLIGTALTRRLREAGHQVARNLLSGGNGAGTSTEPGDRGALQPPDAAPRDRKP